MKNISVFCTFCAFLFVFIFPIIIQAQEGSEILIATSENLFQETPLVDFNAPEDSVDEKVMPNGMLFQIDNDFASNGNYGKSLLKNKVFNWENEWRLGYNDNIGYEVEIDLGFYLGKNRRILPFLGYEWRFRIDGIDQEATNAFEQVNNKDKRTVGTVGIKYFIPWGEMDFQAQVYQDGIVRIQVKKDDLKITKNLLWSFLANTDKEYMMSLKYMFTPGIALSVRYDSDMSAGVGINLLY